MENGYFLLLLPHNFCAYFDIFNALFTLYETNNFNFFPHNPVGTSYYTRIHAHIQFSVKVIILISVVYLSTIIALANVLAYYIGTILL